MLISVLLLRLLLLLQLPALLLFATPIFAATAVSDVVEVGSSYRLVSHSPLMIEKNSIVKVKSDKSGTYLLAVKPGFVTFKQGDHTISLHVFNQNQSQTWSTLKSWVKTRPGLEVLVEQGQIYLTGELLQASDWLSLSSSCLRCQYRARFRLPEALQKEIEADLVRITRRIGADSPSLRFNPDAEWLLPKGKASPSLNVLAKQLGIQTVETDEAVSLSPMVRTQIYVMEVRRDFSRSWGIKWPSSASAQLLPEAAGFMGQTLEFSAQALENEGKAKILASPTLLCRSGEEAEFVAGGEFPIKLANLHSQGVLWKRYGILLKVKPRADRFGRLSISLETEISSIDNSRVVEGVPGLLTNRVLSHFDLRKSSVIALSGLIKNEEGRSSEGIPGLTQIPVLGALFGSKQFRENRTELVIFVKPELMDESHD